MQPRYTAYIIALALLVGSWLFAFGFTLWQLRANALSNAQAMAVTHVTNFEEHLTQTLQTIDLTAGNIEAIVNRQVSQADIGTRLINTLRPTPFLRSISLLDKNGLVVASSNSKNLGVKLDLGNFYPSAHPEADVLRIAYPWRGRDLDHGLVATADKPLTSLEASFIPVLRRLSSAHQERWLLVTLNPDYFVNYFAQLLPLSIGHVQMLRYDGTLLLSSAASDMPGRLTDAGAVPAQLQSREQGSFAQTLANNQQVLTAYRASARFPALIAVHMDRNSALTEWEHEAQRLSLIVIPILVALSVTGILIWRRSLMLATQQAELQRQRQLAASVFDASTDAIIMTAPNGSILSVNPAFENITGYSAQEVLGLNPRLLSSGKQDGEFYRGMWNTLHSTGSWRGEIINRRKDGTLYTGLMSINAVFDAEGQLLHYVGVTADITELKRIDQMKSEFVSTVSHELRTPLTSINGALGLLAGGALGALSANMKQMVDLAYNNSQRLSLLINDLLDMEKLVAGKIVLALEMQPLMPLIEQTLESISTYGSQYQVSFSLIERQEVLVQVDAVRLVQVLNNLLSNAAKFSHKGGQVEVAVRLMDGKVRIEVIDHGSGIPNGFRARIFQKFSQADSSDTRQKGGTGLGLAISKELIERMSGVIGFESEEGHGTCFYFELPYVL